MIKEEYQIIIKIRIRPAIAIDVEIPNPDQVPSLLELKAIKEQVPGRIDSAVKEAYRQ